MNNASTLEQQIVRAREAIAKWPEGKLSTMQLQGADVYRMKGSASTAPGASGTNDQITARSQHEGVAVFG